MSTISAATSSTVLANAGPIKRLGVFQAVESKSDIETKKQVYFLVKNFKEADLDRNNKDFIQFVMDKFSLNHSFDAEAVISYATTELYKARGVGSFAGQASSVPVANMPSNPTQFAKVGLGDLLNGIAVFNASIKNWSADRIKDNWEKFWQGAYQGGLEKFNGDQAKAIKFADEGLQYIIDNTGRGGDRSVLDKALGQLSSVFNIDYTKFVTENEDGTIKLNYDFLKDTEFGKAVGLAQNYGYLVDKAA
jgi:hypothetical protein